MSSDMGSVPDSKKTGREYSQL